MFYFAILPHRQLIHILFLLILLSFCIGDDGQDFISVEHCGDDFIATLAETMQDSEEWDDLQAMESEACGALNNMFDKRVIDNNQPNDNDNSRKYIDILDDSPEPKRRPTLMELDSLSDTEDLDFTIPKQKDAILNLSSCPDGRSQIFTPSSVKHSSKSVVRVFSTGVIRFFNLKLGDGLCSFVIFVAK